jgi:hypothetical protein
MSRFRILFCLSFFVLFIQSPLAQADGSGLYYRCFTRPHTETGYQIQIDIHQNYQGISGKFIQSASTRSYVDLPLLAVSPAESKHSNVVAFSAQVKLNREDAPRSLRIEIIIPKRIPQLEDPRFPQGAMISFGSMTFNKRLERLTCGHWSPR